MKFEEVDIKQLTINPFTLIGDEWMLITAGDEKRVNTMTASWGGMGVLWGENTVTIYVRPQRYTKQFVDAEPRFSLCFFDGCKDRLSLLGTVSGKDRDKITEAGFHTKFIDGVPVFEEAKLIIIAKKMYTDKFKPSNFIEAGIDEKWYDGDHHQVYIAKIEKVYQAK